MQYVVIPAVAFIASGLTLFSGFGLGTLLMPAFALFFPVDVAVAMTAVVHLLNNLFKLTLLGRHAVWPIVARFGLPAVIAAFAGAGLLVTLTGLAPAATYHLGGREFTISWVKLVIAGLMIAFAVFEVLPRFEHVAIDRRYLPIGGVLSGFFGGLSGNQGALRSAFLIRCGLSKEAFVATGVVTACIVDVTRLTVYATHFSSAGLGDDVALVTATTGAAFVGALLGTRVLGKATLRTVQLVVAVMLIGIAAALAAGLV